MKNFFKKKKIYLVTLVLIVPVFIALSGLLKPVISTKTPSFNKSVYSVDEANSLWVIVNKGRKLPANYVPDGITSPHIALRLPSSDPEMGLRPDAAKALQELSEAAANANSPLMLASGYRSYDSQVIIYDSEVQSIGQSQADKESARPGYSEHQTGLAADIEPEGRSCEVQVCFAETTQGIWLANNAYKFGFIIRYQKAKESITGYQYEPWHIRYVGKDLASQIHNSNQTLEQFFDLPAYRDYSGAPFQLKL